MAVRTEKTLHQVPIDEHGPGTVLRDFATLLDFVGVDGVKAGGKYHFLPMGRLFELDERMVHPLRPRLKRPQQRSFPHIQGLYLLLRATMLGVGKGSGSTAHLRIDPQMLSNWRDLNPTERYFNLMEAWLLRGTWEMLGERGGWRGSFLGDFVRFYQQLPKERACYRDDEARAHLRLYNHEQLCHFALMDLFGLADVERDQPAEGEVWRIASAVRTDFGDSLFKFLWERFTDLLVEYVGPDENIGFGQLQPLLGPFFPEWRKNLTLPEVEFRDGIHCFRVSLGKIWRRIAIPATADLDELARTIIRAYNFDGDHLFCFNLRGRDGKQLSVVHPACEGELFTDEVPVGGAPMEVGGEFVFHYDFGADWKFKVKLERIDPADRRIRKVRITESHGASPPEYASGDDGWGDE